MAIYIKRKRKIEEDTSSEQQENVSSNNNQKEAKIIELNKKLVDFKQKISDAKTEFENKVKSYESQKLQIEMELANLGVNIDPNESFKGFGKKLYEALTNKTDEMLALISLTFKSIDDISYIPDDKRCRTFARLIIAYINKWWEFTKDNAEKKLFDFIINLLNKSQISLSNKEKDIFVKKLLENMKENTVFSWMFENVQNEK